MVERFREVYPRHEREVWIYGDATGRGRPAQTGLSDYSVILQGMKTYPTPTRLLGAATAGLIAYMVW
jgi:hypothetical protein